MLSYNPGERLTNAQRARRLEILLQQRSEGRLGAGYLAAVTKHGPDPWRGDRDARFDVVPGVPAAALRAAKTGTGAGRGCLAWAPLLPSVSQQSGIDSNATILRGWSRDFWDRMSSSVFNRPNYQFTVNGDNAQHRVASGRRTERQVDRSKAKPDEVVQTPVAWLSGRTASRATNAYAVRG